MVDCAILAAMLLAPGDPFADGDFRWTASPALIAPADRPDDPCWSIKDPSVVFTGGRWHLFATVRAKTRTHQIEYLTFTDWDHTADARRTFLTCHPTYFCAPQVFWFEPHQRWYLICQASDEAWTPKYQAAYSTNPDIADPAGWTPLQPLGQQPAGDKYGLDFWIIADETTAHLFFTTLDGRMWREETALADFPGGWSEPVLAIEGDIFEASHTYRLLGRDQYLTVVEAQNGHGWRYYKAYLADRLAGPWRPLADGRDRSFANQLNVTQPEPRWTDSISHIELLRAGCDQRMEVDPADPRVVFQGVLERDRAGKPYGEIPWRLGLLSPRRGE